jgi:deazaflavin-dependent oxidoreductase (nitroreductase family)
VARLVCGARNTGRADEVSLLEIGMTETRPAEAWNYVNSDVVTQFRSDNGKVSSGMFKGARLLLLTTIGAKTGKERINPLAFTRDGDNYVIIASKGGSPTHPDWYYNILANPEVGVEAPTQSGVDQFAAHALIAKGDERQRLYDAQAAVMPNFADYQKKTAREIPVIVLEPRRQK